MVNVDKFGFPRGKAKQAKRVHGFQTGDRVKAAVPVGKKKGQYVGTISIRASGSFQIKGQVDGISWRYCRLIQKLDGYNYNVRPSAASFPPTAQAMGFHSGERSGGIDWLVAQLQQLSAQKWESMEITAALGHVPLTLQNLLPQADQIRAHHRSLTQRLSLYQEVIDRCRQIPAIPLSVIPLGF
jgi:hypothetical protein